MEKKLLTSIHDFDDLLAEHHEMNCGEYGDFCVRTCPPDSYPCVIVFEFESNSEGADTYSFEYVYPSDFEVI